MWTAQEHDERLKKLVEYGDASEEVIDIIQEIRTNYDETGGEKWQAKYDELRAKYINRFFGTEEDSSKEANKAKKDEESDIKRDGTKVTFENLFKEREG